MLRFVRLCILFSIITFINLITYAQNAGICQVQLEQAFTSLVENCSGFSGNQVCYVNSVAETNNQSTITASSQQVSSSTSERTQLSIANSEGDNWGVAMFTVETLEVSSINQALVIGFGGLTIESTIVNNRIDLKFMPDTYENSCQDIHPTLILYVEENQIELTLNGETIELSGLITLQWTSQNSLVATVHSGYLDIIDSIVVEPQQTVSSIVDNGTVLFWSAPRQINSQEVQLGESVQNLIAELMGDEVVITDEITTVTTLDAPSPSCGRTLEHTVAAGENLYRIGLRYGVTVEEIATNNNITDYTTLQVGQVLIIACSTVDIDESSQSEIMGVCGPNTIHIVERGETVFAIAQGYGTTVNAIATANNLSDPTLIHSSLQLRIPCDNAPIVSSPPNNSNPIGVDPSAPNFCESILNSAPIGGLSPDMVNLYNQHCT